MRLHRHHARQTAAVVLADLEHVLRLPRHPVRLRAAERQRQPHLPDARREDRRHPDAVDRRAADRPDRAADRRLPVAIAPGRAGPAPAVLPGRRGAGDAGAVRDAELPALWIAAGLLWMLDASINISMEPFRAFVGDQLPGSQRASGYRDAELLHRRRRGRGLLPWLLANGRRGATPRPRARSRTRVRYAFYVGGVVFIVACRLDGAARRANTRRNSSRSSMRDMRRARPRRRR